MQRLTCVARFEEENVGFSSKHIHVIRLVVFILIAVDQVDYIIPISGEQNVFFTQFFGGYIPALLKSGGMMNDLPVEKHKLFFVSAPSEAGTQLQCVVIGCVHPETQRTVKASVLSLCCTVKGSSSG